MHVFRDDGRRKRGAHSYRCRRVFDPSIISLWFIRSVHPGKFSKFRDPIPPPPPPSFALHLHLHLLVSPFPFSVSQKVWDYDLKWDRLGDLSQGYTRIAAIVPSPGLLLSRDRRVDLHMLSTRVRDFSLPGDLQRSTNHLDPRRIQILIP